MVAGWYSCELVAVLVSILLIANKEGTVMHRRHRLVVAGSVFVLLFLLGVPQMRANSSVTLGHVDIFKVCRVGKICRLRAVKRQGFKTG